MKPQYVPKNIGQVLGYLTEEAGEVVAAVGKTIRWGLLSVNPELPAGQQETNAAWIARELHDLERAIRFYREAIEQADAAGNFSFDQPVTPSADRGR